MTGKFNKVLTLICLFILFASGVSCASASSPTGVPSGVKVPEAGKQTAAVQRGNLTISVSVDGNLEMPQAFDLRFGTAGNVEDVFVEEGDFVKAGTVLAMLDNSSQQLDIKSANCSLQQTLSNLYETIPGIQQIYPVTPLTSTDMQRFFPDPVPLPGEVFRPFVETARGYPSYYPNASALLSLEWAQQELATAHDLFLLNKYNEAVSELRLAVSDLESCKKIFQDTLETPSLSGLAEMAPYATLANQFPTGTVYILEQLEKTIELINQSQTDLEKVQSLIAGGNYAESGSIFEGILSQMEDISKKLKESVNKIEMHYDMSYPGKNICPYFYGAAEDKLNEALTLVEKGGLNSAEYNEDLRTAQHYIKICNSILGGNVLVLEHGLSLKNYQSYNVDLAKTAVTLGNSEDNVLKTIIIAPFDGTVVSVGVKKNDVLSAMTYSSSGTIQLVDTKAIKFQGLVDEIDILKIETGQKAAISVDAVPDKVFAGTVTFISPYGTADTTTNVVKFNVTVEIDPADVELKGGLTATADIAVYTAENILLVPLTAVSTTAEGSFVTVVSGAKGQTEKRQVTLGKQNQQFAEVLSGLNEGDEVLIEEKAVTGAPIITAPPGPPGGGGPPPGR